MNEDCTWHPALRWVLFLPFGALASGIGQALLRWANAETPLLAEILARASEPWTFFYVALWIMPAYHVPFSVMAAIIYIAIYISTIYFSFSVETFTSQPWAETVISAVAITSCVFAVSYFSREYGPHPASP